MKFFLTNELEILKLKLWQKACMKLIYYLTVKIFC